MPTKTLEQQIDKADNHVLDFLKTYEEIEVLVSSRTLTKAEQSSASNDLNIS